MKTLERYNAQINSRIDRLKYDIYKKEVEIELLKRDKIRKEKYYCCHCGKELSGPHDLICNTIQSPSSVIEVNLCHQCAIELDNVILDFFE